MRRNEKINSPFERIEERVGPTPAAHTKMVLEVELIYSLIIVPYFGFNVVSLSESWDAQM